MDYRKIISFGKSSYVVSLPKSWVVQNKLGKGDLIYLEENSSGLLLSPHNPQNAEEEKEILIVVDGKPIQQIERELVPAYINNFKTIIFKGKEIKQKAAEIQQLIQSLIALEVMEQTADKIVARDFLDMHDISIPNLLRKMDTITRAMIEDSLAMFTEDNYQNIMHRDHDVNRLSYLIYRMVKYGLRNQSFMHKKFGVDAITLLNYYFITFHIEAVADEAKRIARYMHSITPSLPDKEKRQFEKLYAEVKENYLQTMKAYYTHDAELSYTVARKKNDLIKTCDDFVMRNKDAQWVGYMTDRLKRMVSAVHKLGRLTYQ